MHGSQIFFLQAYHVEFLATCYTDNINEYKLWQNWKINLMKNIGIFTK